MALEVTPIRRPLAVVTPPKRWEVPQLREAWSERALLRLLVARDLGARYAQAWLGVAWIVLKPLATMLILWVVFGRAAGVAHDGIPYPLFSAAGLVIWLFFASVVGDSVDALLGNASLLTKVYVPRILLPLSILLSRLVDLGVMLLLLVGVWAYYGEQVGWSVLALPAILAALVILAAACAVATSAVALRYRDVAFVVPIGLQLLLFASPVIYASSMLPRGVRDALEFDPLTGLMGGLRASLADGSLPYASLGIAVAEIVIACLVSAWVFARLERSFADTV